MTHHTTLDQQTLPEEKGGMDRLNSLLQKLPAGQRRVAKALIAGDDARTYRQVASSLGLHRGTVNQHLRSRTGSRAQPEVAPCSSPASSSPGTIREANW